MAQHSLTKYVAPIAQQHPLTKYLVLIAQQPFLTKYVVKIAQQHPFTKYMVWIAQQYFFTNFRVAIVTQLRPQMVRDHTPSAVRFLHVKLHQSITCDQISKINALWRSSVVLSTKVEINEYPITLCHFYKIKINNIFRFSPLGRYWGLRTDGSISTLTCSIALEAIYE